MPSRTALSAVPRLAADTVPLCLLILAVITVLNLRGLGEAARAFLLPTAGSAPASG